MDELQHVLAVDTATFIYNANHVVDPETLLSVCCGCGLIIFEPETRLVNLITQHVTFWSSISPMQGLMYRPCWLALALLLFKPVGSGTITGKSRIIKNIFL
ncbi:hypothetical protein FA15DRAFT_516339 [Coprinopsis marcescibilis]|uniref:Uncharacterized protein n=1 Tax=Coprinopsis marcescibilis TaxID=230819 RepID=A0A5C3KRP7_COPMA|nr:hypothetical protein FA15DRAFT_516339 [Coprinopsis marcescibilis]